MIYSSKILVKAKGQHEGVTDVIFFAVKYLLLSNNNKVRNTKLLI